MPLVLLVAWPAMILGFHAGAPWQNFRFTLAALPPLAVLVGLGAAQVAVWLNGSTKALTQPAAGPPRSASLGGTRHPGSPHPAPLRGTRLPLGQGAAWIVFVLVGVGVAWQAWAGFQLTQQFILRKRGDLAIVAGVDSQAPPNAQLLTFSMTGTFSYYSDLPTHELWGLDSRQVADLVGDGRPTVVLLDVANVEAQWKGLSPSNNYHWLRDGPGLNPLGQFENYTLFQVR